MTYMNKRLPIEAVIKEEYTCAKCLKTLFDCEYFGDYCVECPDCGWHFKKYLIDKLPKIIARHEGKLIRAIFILEACRLTANETHATDYIMAVRRSLEDNDAQDIRMVGPQ